MYIRKLVASVILCKLEGIIKFFLVGLKINGSFNKTIFDQELSATICAHSFGNFDSNFTELLLCAV